LTTPSNVRKLRPPRLIDQIGSSWAFSSLATAAYEAAETDSDETPPTYCLSAFFDPIVQKLLETTGTEFYIFLQVC
jgi:hypothetical protein